MFSRFRVLLALGGPWLLGFRFSLLFSAFALALFLLTLTSQVSGPDLSLLSLALAFGGP